MKIYLLLLLLLCFGLFQFCGVPKTAEEGYKKIVGEDLPENVDVIYYDYYDGFGTNWRGIIEFKDADELKKVQRMILAQEEEWDCKIVNYKGRDFRFYKIEFDLDLNPEEPALDVLSCNCDLGKNTTQSLLFCQNRMYFEYYSAMID